MKLEVLVGFASLMLSAELAAAAPKRLSLAEVISKVRDNPAARAANAEHDAARARADEARGARWPRLRLTTFVAPSPDIDCDNADCTTTSPVDFAPSIQGVFAGARLEVFQPLYTFGKLAFFDCGGTRLYLQQGETKPESILYFRVADIHTVAKALGEKEVEFVSAPHMVHRHEDGTEEWMAFFNDPEGRPLALMARAERG